MSVVKCPVCGYVAKSIWAFYSHKKKHPQLVKKNGTLNLNNFFKEEAPLIPTNIIYNDWCNYLPILHEAYKQKLFVLIVGPKGTGKTTLVRKFAEMIKKPLYSVNFSLRTKESHLVGATLLQNGTTKFALGIIPKSMQEGALLYLDEVNVAEPDVLIRLDEALDDRRELVLKEAGEVVTVKARDDWFVIATINPLTHAGTKELPPQLLSRFPVRLHLDYPPPEVEKEIIRMYVNGVNGISNKEN